MYALGRHQKKRRQKIQFRTHTRTNAHKSVEAGDRRGLRDGGGSFVRSLPFHCCFAPSLCFHRSRLSFIQKHVRKDMLRLLYNGRLCVRQPKTPAVCTVQVGGVTCLLSEARGG